MSEETSEHHDGKPPIPGHDEEWQRIPIDEGNDGAFAQVLRIGVFAADQWTFGPDGPYSKPRTAADTARGQIREALLHLLELGLVDIDVERLNAVEWFPPSREREAGRG